MFRLTALRSLQRSIPSCNVLGARSAWRSATSKAQLASPVSAANTPKRLSLALRKPIVTSLVRYQSTINKATEEEYGKRTLQAEPAAVTTGSSVRQVTGEAGVDDPEPDVDMMAGVKSDFVSIITPCNYSQVVLMASTPPESHLRHILTQGCPERSSLRWHGWCSAVPCYLRFHRVLGLRYTACSKYRFGLASFWRDCGAASSYPRADPARLRRHGT